MQPFFDSLIGEGLFVRMTFIYAVSNITSYLTSRFVFKGVRTQTIMCLNLGVAVLCFTFMSLLCGLMKTQVFLELIVLSLVYLFSYFEGSFLGNLSGFASACGPQSIVLFSIGLSLAGFGSNVISIIFAYIFPTNLIENKEKNLFRQLICYLVLMNMLFIIHLCIFFKFKKYYGMYFTALDIEKNKEETVTDQPTITHPDMIEVETTMSNEDSNMQEIKPKNGDLELVQEPKYNGITIIWKSLDIWLGVLFNYTITLEAVCFMIPQLTQQYDKGNEIFLLSYFFIYNFCDAIGRIIPSRFQFKSVHLLHLSTFLRIFIHVYFTVLVMYDVPPYLSHYTVRGFMFLLVGVSNGFLTNNYFCFASNRFTKAANKDLAGFLTNFGLIVGITAGTFDSVLWYIQ
jgi:hypothetical protein